MGRREGECENSWLSKVFDERYVTFKLVHTREENPLPICRDIKAWALRITVS